ncbi:MAG: 50S ribosomal protein L9 [Acidobacteriota bacterium]|nr:MAG: 50S ribosomal protein L9 [Acidobacteriota bacterium]
MELILRDDVPDLGRRGEIVDVAAGFARNYLIPKRLAYRITPGIRRQVEIESRAREAQQARARSDADALAARLQELQVLRFQRRVGAAGVLYGSVTSAEIAEALVAQGIAVDRRDVRLDEPIKRMGTHRVTVHVYGELNVELAIEVEPEEGSEGGE